MKRIMFTTRFVWICPRCGFRCVMPANIVRTQTGASTCSHFQYAIHFGRRRFATKAKWS